MKKLLFSAAIMMIVTSPALAGGVDCKGCDSSARQEVWGPPDVPPAAYPRGYPYSPGYITSYGGVARCARHTDRRIAKQVRHGCPRS
jgi:hypothetical protein